MNVYEFEKSLLTRLEESSNVLQCKDVPVPASEVLSEWAYHIELQIEPAGWQTLWKISRVTCEDLGIKYPTVVFGTVTNVLFKALKAEFEVIAVQDEDVHIPETHIVPLEDLWPTKHQENSALNVDRTADCIDQLRFFCRNVWMPWDNDNDDDLDWAEKHLESRIRFCFDLKRGLSRPMADRIRILLNEARYLQSRRDLIEIDIADNDDDDFDGTPNKRQLTDLMRFHLRLAVIRNEIEMLENPDMRKIYEEINFPKENGGAADKKPLGSYIVVKDDTIPNQINYLDAAKAFVGNEEIVKIISSLKDCLKICSSSDKIYIPLGQHMIKFLEPLNSNGLLKAIIEKQEIITSVESLQKRIGEKLDATKDAIIVSEEEDSNLLVFNGDYVIENITFDCRNVRLGLWCRSGIITLKNCILIGNRNSSTGNGIVVAGGATLNLENTLTEQFSTGITCASGGKVSLKNSIVSHCNVGLNFNDSSIVNSVSSLISNCSEYGIVFEASDLNASQKKTILKDSVELINVLGKNKKSLQFAGECNLENNKKGNVLIFNHKKIADLENSAFIEDFEDFPLDSSLENKEREVNMDTDTSK